MIFDDSFYVIILYDYYLKVNELSSGPLSKYYDVLDTITCFEFLTVSDVGNFVYVFVEKKKKKIPHSTTWCPVLMDIQAAHAMTRSTVLS